MIARIKQWLNRRREVMAGKRCEITIYPGSEYILKTDSGDTYVFKGEPVK